MRFVLFEYVLRYNVRPAPTSSANLFSSCSLAAKSSEKSYFFRRFLRFRFSPVPVSPEPPSSPPSSSSLRLDFTAGLISPGWPWNVPPQKRWNTWKYF